jgi:hypothetical protein
MPLASLYPLQHPEIINILNVQYQNQENLERKHLENLLINKEKLSKIQKDILTRTPGKLVNDKQYFNKNHSPPFFP